MKIKEKYYTFENEKYVKQYVGMYLSHKKHWEVIISELLHKILETKENNIFIWCIVSSFYIK